QREKRLQGIQQLLTNDKDNVPPQWYVNSQGQTMVVIPGPVEFMMGSPETEEGRLSRDTLHRKRIGRTFAIATQSVTVEQFRRYLKANTEIQKDFDSAGEATEILERCSPEQVCPIILESWYMAARYCNWLSQQEGLAEKEWCYVNGKYGEGMTLA